MTEYHKQPSHMHELSPINLDSSYPVETRSLYTSRSESLIPEKVNGPLQVNFSSNSSFFEQEVPSSYSSVSGRDNGDRYERPQMPPPLPLHSAQDASHTSQPMAPLIHTPIDQTHVAYARPFPASTDPSDQPLVFEQRYSFDNGQNQKINYKDVSITGSLGVMEHVEAAPAHIWTPSVAFSQTSTVTAAQQFDSSYGNLSKVAGDHSLVFGRIPGPSFHPTIPAVTQFGLPSGAPLHPLTTFSDDAGAFGHVERPKKRSVPNWLREEIIKNKASIVSSTSEQPSGSIHSVGIHDDEEKSFRRADEIDSKSNDSRSVEDDEVEEDEAEAARTAAINQEIKRILTDILLKVTDELFQEIATNIINEDELTVEGATNVSLKDHPLGTDISCMDINAPISNLHSQESRTPKTAGRVTGPMQGDPTKSSNVKNTSSVSLQGNLLGLANYDSDADEDDLESSVVKPLDPHSHVLHPAKCDRGSENTSMAMEKGTHEEKPMPSEDFALKQVSVDARQPPQVVGHGLSDGSGAGHLSTGGIGRNSNLGIRDSMGGKSNKETELMRNHTAQSTSCEDKHSEDKSGSASRSHGKATTGNNVIKVGKSGKNNVDSVASDHKRGSVGDRVKEKPDKKDILQRTPKGHESRERDGDKFNLNGRKGTGKDKRGTGKDADDIKREQVKNISQERHIQGERDSHRSKIRHSPSLNKAMNSKENSLSSHGLTSSGETIEDSKKRRSHSNRRSLSRSPPRSRKREVSRSPPSKHSQRRQSPYSYSEKRRRSRSASPVRRRR